MKPWETALDERGERAAKSLQDAIAATHEDAVSASVVGDIARNGANPMTEAAEAVPGEVDHLPTARDRRNRPAWLVAAGVFAVGLVGVTFTVLRDDDTPTAVTTDPDPDPTTEYLAAGWLPEDWESQYETLVPESDAMGSTGDVAVYGPTGTDEPWTKPLLSAVRYDNQESADFWLADSTEETTVGDQPGILEIRGDVIRVRPTGGDDHVAVVGYGLEQDVVIDAAAHIVTDPVIDLEDPPDDYEEIARGPLSAGAALGMNAFDALSAYFSDLGGTHSTMDGLAGLSTAYGSAEEHTPAVVLGQRTAEGPEAAGLLALFALDPSVATEVEETEVRGQPAYRVRGSDDTRSPDGSVVVDMTVTQWYEPSLGLVVTTVAFDTDDAVLDQFIDGLETSAEVPDSGGEVGLVNEQLTVEGTHEGAPWELDLLLSFDGSSYAYEESFDHPNHSSSGSGSITAPAGASEFDPAELDGLMKGSVSYGLADGTEGSSNSEVMVVGYTSAEATEAVIQGPSGETWPAEVQPLTASTFDWSATVVVASVPGDESDVRLITKDADGNVLDDLDLPLDLP